MNVLLVINELNIRGGTHKQLLRLCEFLSKENNVIIYTRTCDLSKTYPDFKKFRIVSSELNYDEKNFFLRQLKKIKNNKIENKIFSKLLNEVDVVNFHDKAFSNLFKLTKKKGLNIIFQINDIPNFFHQGVSTNEKDSIISKMKRVLYKKHIKYVDEITVNVTKNKEVVKKCLDRDAKVFYCGVDVNDKLEKHNSIHNENKLQLFSSGVFFPYRNYETLVKVIKKLRDDGVDAYLNIMGSTSLCEEYANKIRNMINDLNLEKYVSILGQVNDNEYIRLHNEADMFLFININQSWGLAVFEAMSCGLPVIVSDSVGAIEILNNGKDSIILDPENVEIICDEILKLKNDSKYYSFISNNAYNSVKNFSWDNLYNSKMEELLKKYSKE